MCALSTFFPERGVNEFYIINAFSSIIVAGKPLVSVNKPNSKDMQTHAVEEISRD